VGRRLVTAIALLCFTGCSWTATIARTDALDNEAEIDHSDADALYLLARNGGMYRIPRQSIRGIDHPGNVEMLIGAILLGFGTWITADQWDRNKDDARAIALVYGIPGLALLLTGLFRYIPSRRAAWAFQFADRPDPPLPPPGTYYPPPPPPAASLPPSPPPPPAGEVAPPPAPAPAPPAEPEPQVIPTPTSPP